MKSIWGHGGRYLRINNASIDINPRIERAFLWGIGVLIAVIFIAGDAGLWRLWSAQKTLLETEREIAVLEVETSRLQRDIHALRTDPFAAEKVARELFGYVRPGDRVYRIITMRAGEESEEGSRTPLDNGPRRP
ncbi:MAG: septum formation initiator family protein [Candidatus Krumholzibacteria bacterium]|nr:septum formation initiator family protein [Candidatus Krumholzibacteria bacterium]